MPYVEKFCTKLDVKSFYAYLDDFSIELLRKKRSFKAIKRNCFLYDYCQCLLSIKTILTKSKNKKYMKIRIILLR